MDNFYFWYGAIIGTLGCDIGALGLIFPADIVDQIKRNQWVNIARI